MQQRGLISICDKLFSAIKRGQPTVLTRIGLIFLLNFLAKQKLNAKTKQLDKYDKTLSHHFSYNSSPSLIIQQLLQIYPTLSISCVKTFWWCNTIWQNNINVCYVTKFMNPFTCYIELSLKPFSLVEAWFEILSQITWLQNIPDIFWL